MTNRKPSLRVRPALPSFSCRRFFQPARIQGPRPWASTKQAVWRRSPTVPRSLSAAWTNSGSPPSPNEDFTDLRESTAGSEFEGGADVDRLAVAAIVGQRRNFVPLDLVADAAGQRDVAADVVGAADVDQIAVGTREIG